MGAPRWPSWGGAGAAPGELDPTFGAGGKLLTGFGAASAGGAHGVAIQPNGKIVVAGLTNRVFVLARYRAR